MQRDKKLKSLGKIIATILGRNPDAHGILPDSEGWIKMKTLLQSLNELPDIRGIREADLVDICRNTENSPLEMQDEKIRAKDRLFASGPDPEKNLSKLLHICIRRKAWSHVFEKGLKSSDENPLLLTPDPELALRMGKRKDPSPISLKVNTQKALDAGILFWRHGEHLFSALKIFPDLLTGPPLNREKKPKPAPKTPEKPKKETFTPGSFLLRSEEEKAASKYAKDKKDSWKHNKKRLRREREPREDS